MTDAETLDPTENLEIPEEATGEEVTIGAPESAGGDNNDEQEDDDEYEEDTGPSRLTRFKQWFIQNKKKTIPLTVALVLGIIFGVPASRYAVLGLVLKKTYVVAVTDAKTNLPVSEVELNYRGKSLKTNADGKATFVGVPVGRASLKATKKYYSENVVQMLVPLNPEADFRVSLSPTGRQVPIKAVNKITGKPLAGVVLSVADSQVKTDEKGEATIVLPPEKTTLEGTVKASGYNDQKVQVQVSHLAVKENTYQLVPAGKLYYLSKRTGKINVMKANLDGSNQAVVLAATGNELEDDTILLASRDWQYLALKSRRDGAAARLYLIETSTDKLTEIEGVSANITLVGWSGHRMAYQVQHSNIQLWQDKRITLKTYDADKKQSAVLAETNGEGVSENDYVATEIQKASILADRILYNTVWFSGYNGSSRLQGKKHAITSVSPDGSNKQILKDFDAKLISYIDTVQPEVGEVYYRVYTNNVGSFYAFKDGKVEAGAQMTEEKYNKPYPTFLISPTAESTFWHEQRDGKNTLFVGNGSGHDGKEIASLSEYSPYGWLSDNYVLVSKGGSELFILPSNGAGTTGQIIKITDYHKPATSFYGYGYGYGGL